MLPIHSKTTKRIVIIAEFPVSAISKPFLGRGGGQDATWLPQLANAFSKQKKFEIHWVIFDKAANVESCTEWLGQYFHILPGIRKTWGFLTGMWDEKRKLRKLFHVLKPSLIHCWGTETFNPAALRIFKGPSILSMQGIVTAYRKTGKLPGWRWAILERWESKSIRLASVITSESIWGMERVKKLVLDADVRRVEYGVTPTFYEVDWKPDFSRPRFLFAGGLSHLKGVDILVELLKRHKECDWTMVFAGDGELKGQIQKLDVRHVEVLGTITTSELQGEMSRAWGLILPSRADTSPNVVKEARVVGLPVIVSPHGGQAGYVEDGIDGFCVDSETPERWFQAIDRLAHDFELCQTMGNVNRQKYRDYFRPENTAGNFLRLYHELLS